MAEQSTVPNHNNEPLDTQAHILGRMAAGFVLDTPETEYAGEKLANGFQRLPSGAYFLPVKYGLKTDIPPDSFTTVGEGVNTRVLFSPAAMDKLPDSSYRISTTSSFGAGRGEETILKLYTSGNGGRHFTVEPVWDKFDDPELIDAVSALPLVPGHRLVEGSAKQLIDGITNPYRLEAAEVPSIKILGAAAGMELVDGDFGKSISSVPTPETLKAAVDTWGARVKLVHTTAPNGMIPVKDYVGSFAEGAYPIGVGGTFTYYSHDVGRDHLVGVLAAPRLLDLIAPFAAMALAKGDSHTLSSATDFLDGVTTSVRQAYLNMSSGFYEVGKQGLITAAKGAHKLAGKLGVDFNQHEFVQVVLEDLRGTGIKLDWSEDRVEKMQKLMDPQEKAGV